MTTPGVRLAALTRNVWLRRATAVGILVTALGASYWAMNLPTASPVENTKSWKLDAGDQVTLLGPTPSHVFTFQGPIGKGVSARFTNAALTPASAQGLQALGVVVNGQPAAVQWITADGGSSRASVSVDLQPTGPHPALGVQLTSGDGIAELTFQGQDAQLRAVLSGALVGQGQPPADVTVGATAFRIQANGALPIEVEAPPGAPFTLRFSQAAVAPASTSGPSLDWGGLVNSQQRLTVLKLTGVRVNRPGEGDRIYACGASANAVAWTTTDVAKLTCQPTLQLQELSLSPDGGALRVIGSGFVVQGGESNMHGWEKALQSPVPSAFLAVAITGLVGWTMRLLLKPPPAAPRRRKPRKAA